MKKVFLSTAAVAGLMLAAPVQAGEPALQLGLGGLMAGYAVYTDNDAPTGDSRREFDFRKKSQVELNGEVALDNGITAGANIVILTNRADGGATVDASYMYLASEWGRINFGEEDGAAFLLQVAAPSADALVDGVRVDIDTFAYDLLSSAATAGGGDLFDADSAGLDYGQEMTNFANKLTYFTPVFNGFQAGASFTPSVSDADLGNLAVVQSDDDVANFENALEIAARYEGSFDAIDLALGAGYGTMSTEQDAAAAAVGSDSRKQWNLGVNIGWDAFGLGVAYLHDNNGIDTNGDTKTWVAGVDYVAGPYKFGLSYLNRVDEANNAAALDAGFTDDIEVERWTGGVIYEWGPGMTFRGAVAHVDMNTDQAGDTERSASRSQWELCLSSNLYKRI